MVQFILFNLFLISVGVVVYLFARALPRVPEDTAARRQGVLERWIASEIPEKIDASFNLFLGKFLRRLKLFLLKVDNVISERLQKMQTLENGAAGPHFEPLKKVAENREGEE